MIENPSNSCLHQWFEQCVARTPDAVAVLADEQSHSYRQVNRRANRLAAELISRGAGPGKRVALCLDRSSDLIVGIIAVLKSGAAYVPIDPSVPTERLEFIVNDCQSQWIVSTSSLAERFQFDSGQLIEVPDGDVSADHDENPVGGAQPSDLAYIIYTSGSTGTPKGVMVSHHNVVRLFTKTEPWFDFGPQDTWTLFHSYAFDFSVWEIWGALLYGGKLVVVPYATSRSPRDFYRLLSDHQVTILNQTPSAFRQLILADEELNSSHSLNLRKVILGGEALDFRTLRPWIDRHGDSAPELINMYGITETTVFVTYRPVTAKDVAHESGSCIGVPIPDLQVYVMDEQQQEVATGTVGEIYVGGEGVAPGYWNRPDLTSERFLPTSLSEDPNARLYKTGDLGRFREDGELEYHGRIDRQVQLRGFRIELGEIEARLQELTSVAQAIAHVRDAGDSSGPQLLAYIVAAEGQPIAPTTLRNHLAEKLPEHMIPQFFVPIDTIPLTVNGKLDADRLPAPQAIALDFDYLAPATDAERTIASIWQELLGLEQVTCNASFFELGGQSVMLPEMERRFSGKFSRPFKIVDIFQQRTITDLANYLSQPSHDSGCRVRSTRQQASTRDDDNQIAIVGMAGRFPGANSVAQLWDNLKNGVESIRTFSRQELIDAGVCRTQYEDPRFVPAAARIENLEDFDAEFFGLSPHEARITDPQHRLFIESAWTALEDAGFNFNSKDRRIGVFAGARVNTYRQLVNNRLDVGGQPNLAFETLLSNEKDFLATRVAHRFDLHGPAMTVQTGCSTSLVAVQLASQALQSGQCSMALAGGVSVYLENRHGYLFEEGMILSPDGRVRAFDADAQGTVFGDGVGVVVLKRLSDAVRDNDSIYAVIRSVAVNNDGGAKTGFAAPSIDGQAEVIQMALGQANVLASDIGYIETHGTGTYIGDPIEIAALSQAFGSEDVGARSVGARSVGAQAHPTDGSPQRCAIGSAKANVGHLDAAAGMVGLMKAAMVVRDGVIPPSIHFDRPNPNIDFENSPFSVSTRLTNWSSSQPRLAGISSFGVGGTNAHAIVAQPPPPVTESSHRPSHLVPLSARTEDALHRRREDLVEFLNQNPHAPLADVAFSLQRRASFSHRECHVVESVEQLTSGLQSFAGPGTPSRAARLGLKAPVVFLFPGQGAQHLNMAREIYDTEAIFRLHFDHCAELLMEPLGCDLRQLVFMDTPTEEAKQKLNQTAIAQPAIFTVSYSLARWLESLGIVPSSLIGHSIGEFAAATLAGVFDLEDAVRVIAARGRHMQQLPPGNMMAVRLPESEVAVGLPAEVSLAAINSPVLCVLSGPSDQIEQLRQRYEGDDVGCRILHTSHAFHSAMMDPVIAPLTQQLRSVSLRPPEIPIISSVTGLKLSDAEATDPAYWANHLREPVRFCDSLLEAAKTSGSETVFLEVGPGQTLGTLARQNLASQNLPAKDLTTQQPESAGQSVQSILPHATQSVSSASHALTALGRMWQAGVELDYSGVYRGEERSLWSLPTYPFERRRHWVDQMESAPMGGPETPTPISDTDTRDPENHTVPVGDGHPEPREEASSTPHGTAQRIILQQLGIMQKQLEAFRR